MHSQWERTPSPAVLKIFLQIVDNDKQKNSYGFWKLVDHALFLFSIAVQYR